MKKIIDLSITLQNDLRGVELEQKYTTQSRGWNAKTLHLYSHCGTHIDAPVHYDANDNTITDIPLERCMVECWVADITDIKAREQITVEHLGHIRDKIQTDKGLILKTGWSKQLGSPEYYLDLPRISMELAEWCVEKGISLLGVESHAIADPNNREEIIAIHRVLLKENIIIVEGLMNLDAIPDEKFTLMVFPLKIAEGDGSPVRAVGIIEQD
jgi:kynurenine formamidase